jgi:hypothetical protein
LQFERLLYANTGVAHYHPPAGEVVAEEQAAEQQATACLAWSLFQHLEEVV